MALACAVLLLFALCGCDALPEEPSPSESASQTPAPSPAPSAVPARFALGYSAAGSLHPLQAADQGSLDVDTLVYEGLFRLDGSFEAQPVLAQSATARPDGLVWTVTLRADAAFSDGTPLTAEHVAAALLAAKQSARYAGRLANLAGVVPGAGAVTITLLAPNGALPALLDVPIFLEREEGGLPLGTGPYAFAGEGQELCLTANAAWWRGKTPAWGEIPLRSCASLEDQAAAFGSGEVTAVTCDFNAAGAVGYSGSYESHDFPTTDMLYVGFNAAQGRICSDARVRAALARALDRGAIAATRLAGHAASSALPVHPASPLYSAEAAGRLSYDLEAAAELLEEAGWTLNEDGARLQRRQALALTLCVNRDSAVKRSVADQIAAALEELGITVTVEALDWSAYTAALAGGNFDLYLGEVKLTADFDFSALLTGGLSYGASPGEELLAALNACRGAVNTARPGAAQALWDVFTAQVPFAPLCFKSNTLLARWGMVQGLAPQPGAPFAGIENWSTSS